MAPGTGAGWVRRVMAPVARQMARHILHVGSTDRWHVGSCIQIHTGSRTQSATADPTRTGSTVPDPAYTVVHQIMAPHLSNVQIYTPVQHIYPSYTSAHHIMYIIPRTWDPWHRIGIQIRYGGPTHRFSITDNTRGSGILQVDGTQDGT